MKAFIFDKYGYYVDDNVTKFDYASWHFELELTDKTESDLLSMKEFLSTIPKYYPGYASDIVFSRDNKLLQDSIYGKVCLIAVKKSNVSINDILSFSPNFTFMAGNKILKVSYLKSVWINKVDRIEEKILSKVKIDDKTYKMMMELYIYNVGLSETAIQYLSDTMYLYGDDIENISLSHKRIKDLNSYTFLNPLNFIIDFQSRDLVELIKNDLISVSEFKKIISSYNISQKEASLILARLLYPTDLYDLLEEFYLTKKDISIEIFSMYKNMSSKLEKIKKVYNILIDLYKIKPINWIDII